MGSNETHIHNITSQTYSKTSVGINSIVWAMEELVFILCFTNTPQMSVGAVVSSVVCHQFINQLQVTGKEKHTSIFLA